MTLEIQSQTIGKKNHPQAYGLRSQLLGSKFQVCCVTCTSRLPSLCPGFLHYTMETTAAHTSGLSQRLPVLGTVNAQLMLPLLLFLSGKKKYNRHFKHSLPVPLRDPRDISVHHGIQLQSWPHRPLKVLRRCNVSVLCDPRARWVERGCFLPLCFKPGNVTRIMSNITIFPSKTQYTVYY